MDQKRRHQILGWVIFALALASDLDPQAKAMLHRCKQRTELDCLPRAGFIADNGERLDIVQVAALNDAGVVAGANDLDVLPRAQVKVDDSGDGQVHADSKRPLNCTENRELPSSTSALFDQFG